MNHKRGKPKNSRSGCLGCKPHKANGAKGSFVNQTIQEQKAIRDEEAQVVEFESEDDTDGQ